jgi:hypothetical protein
VAAAEFGPAAAEDDAGARWVFAAAAPSARGTAASPAPIAPAASALAFPYRAVP